MTGHACVRKLRKNANGAGFGELPGGRTRPHREGGHTPTPQGQPLLYSGPSQTSPYTSLHLAVHLNSYHIRNNVNVSVGLSFPVIKDTPEDRFGKNWHVYVQQQAAADQEQAEQQTQVCSFTVLMSDNLAIRQESSSLSKLVFSKS